MTRTFVKQKFRYWKEIDASFNTVEDAEMDVLNKATNSRIIPNEIIIVNSYDSGHVEFTHFELDDNLEVIPRYDFLTWEEAKDYIGIFE